MHCSVYRTTSFLIVETGGRKCICFDFILYSPWTPCWGTLIAQVGRWYEVSLTMHLDCLEYCWSVCSRNCGFDKPPRPAISKQITNCKDQRPKIPFSLVRGPICFWQQIATVPPMNKTSMKDLQIQHMGWGISLWQGYQVMYCKSVSVCWRYTRFVSPSVKHCKT